MIWGLGSIFQKAPHVYAIRGVLTREGQDGSYEQLMGILANESGDVTLDFDCHGGESIGVIACARAIAEHGSVHAYVSGVCASAAYILAAGCVDITATEDAKIGSIGTMLVAPDLPMGYRTSQFSPRKNRPDEQIDEMLNSDAARILNFVAMQRRFGTDDMDKIAHQCGDGALMTAQAALAKGLIDSIEITSTRETVMADMPVEKQQPQGIEAKAETASKETVDLSAVLSAALQQALAPITAELADLRAQVCAKSEEHGMQAEAAQAHVSAQSVAKTEESADKIEQRLAELEARTNIVLAQRVTSPGKVKAPTGMTPIQQCKAMAKEQNITFTQAVTRFVGGDK